MDTPIRRSPLRRAAPWLLGAALLVGLIGGGVYLARDLDGVVQVATDDVRLATVTQADFAEVLPTRASVAPAVTVFIDAPESGQVAQVLVSEGDVVRAGQLLATLSNARLEREIVSSEAEIAGRLADIQEQRQRLRSAMLETEQAVLTAEFELRRAEREEGIRRRLHEAGFVSDAGLQAATEDAAFQSRRVRELRESLAALREGVRQQEAELASTARWLQEARSAVRGAGTALAVRAPTNGQLTGFEVRVGQMIAVGDRVGQVDDTSSSLLVAAIDEFYLDRIAVGQVADAEIGQANVPVEVRRVLPQVRDGRFRIELAFLGLPPEGLRRGQTVDVRMVLGQSRPALVLPRGAWLNDGGGNHAYVVRADGTAVRQPIQVGRRSVDRVEILSGLSAGDRVIVSGTAGFGNAQTLRLDGAGPGSR